MPCQALIVDQRDFARRGGFCNESVMHEAGWVPGDLSHV